MARHKGKTKRVQHVHAGTKNKSKEMKENPFEVRINKRRYDILGRKMKHERGNPGVSRSRGLKKREKTLLVEYKQRNKANTFVDKRFGEYDENLSLEEKMLRRFATEKQKHHEKYGLFSLEDEELTHFGQSLGEIKHFDGPVLSDDENELDVSGLGDDQHHFGGFLKRKSQDSEKLNNEPRSKKEIMEEVVANAKIKKYERQVAKEEADTMRQKLDEGLDSIRSLLSFRADAQEPEPRQKADDYDRVVREMAFEMKAQATDKLKTEEQLARIEEERLKKLESERIHRMKGLPREEKKPSHISADDLVDCYAVDTDTRSLLSYKDGKMVIPDDYDSNENDDVDMNEKEDEAEEEESEEEEEEDGDGSTDEGDSDIESSDSESSEHEMEELGPAQADKTRKKEMSKPISSAGKTTTVMYAATTQDDIPYTFTAPGTYQEFHKLVRNRSTSDMLTIVERIEKCNHPKLNPANKTKMEVFFDILIKYIDELLSQTRPELQAVDGLVCHLFNLVQHSPVHTARSMQKKLKEIQKEFCELNRKQKVPDLRTVLYIRIISVLFPTSDFRHGVCTPALTFMGQILSQISVQSLRDIFIGLFICNLVYEFVRASKRYVPEVINYLTGVLYLSSEKNEPLGKLFPPFKPHSKHKDILKISSYTASSSQELKSVNVNKIFTNDVEENENSRSNALYTCLVLLKKFLELYSDLVSFPEIFEPVAFHMKRITISNHPSTIQSLHANTLQTITSHVTKRQPLALQTRRPTPIQMFEPKFDEHYEVKRKHSSGNKNVNERQKLRYKHKKEFKGAVREIRKDSQFLARQQMQEQLQRDAERAQKTKEIQAMLSNQQAEANAFNRKKRKMKN